MYLTFAHIRPALVFVALFTLICGLVYPVLVTGVVHTAFPTQATGSLMLDEDGAVVGSGLIGQNFTAREYFWGRPSATYPTPYNAGSSSGSNLAANSPDLLTRIIDRREALLALDKQENLAVPADLVTASGSGLDPHITIAAARYQLQRVAHARGQEESDVDALIQRFTEGRQFGLLGQPRVNVLKLNLALDGKLKADRD